MITSLILMKLHLLILIKFMTTYLSKLVSDSLSTKLQIPVNRVSTLASHHLHINEPRPRAAALLDLEFLAQSHAKTDHQQIIVDSALNQTSADR